MVRLAASPSCRPRGLAMARRRAQHERPPEGNSTRLCRNPRLTVERIHFQSSENPVGSCSMFLSGGSGRNFPQGTSPQVPKKEPSESTLSTLSVTMLFPRKSIWNLFRLTTTVVLDSTPLPPPGDEARTASSWAFETIFLNVQPEHGAFADGNPPAARDSIREEAANNAI